MTDTTQIGSLELIQTLEGHRDRVWNCCWSPKGDMLATCGGDKTHVIIWTQQNSRWEIAQVLKDHDRTVRRVAFSPDGKLLASASFDSTTSVYELSDGKFKLIQHLEGHDNEVKGVAWDCSGSLLATCSRDKSVWIYMLESDMQMDCCGVGQSHSQDVKSVLWHPTREMLLSCSYDDSMKIWQEDDDDWNCTETLHGHKSTVWDAVFEPTEGNYLVSCSEDASLILWKFTNQDALPAPGDEINRFVKLQEDRNTHPRTIYSVDWSRKSNLIATGGADDAVRILRVPQASLEAKSDTGSDQKLMSLLYTQSKAHLSDVNCVKWSPNDLIIASCGDDKVVKLWKYTE